MSEKSHTPHDPEDEQEARHREGLDFLVNVADQRIAAWMDANMPAVVQQVVDQISERINPEQIAVQAERIFEQRWNEEAKRRRAAAGGGGGGDIHRPTTSGGGDGDDDASFLNDVDGVNDDSQQLVPVPANARQAVAVGGLRLLEDPLASIERMLNLAFDVMDRRRPQQPQRHDLDVLEEIATRRPYLVDLFASQDPASAPEKLAHAMMDGAKSGLSVAEALAKHSIRGATSKPPPKWKPPELEISPAPTRTEPSAPMAQDGPARPRRGRRLRDAV